MLPSPGIKSLLGQPLSQRRLVLPDDASMHLHLRSPKLRSSRHLLGGDSPVWLRTHRLLIPLLTIDDQSHARGKCCHSRTREGRSCTAMNTQLLRYNVLIELLTLPPIPPAMRDFGRTGRTHGLQPTPLARSCIAARFGSVRRFELEGPLRKSRRG